MINKITLQIMKILYFWAPRSDPWLGLLSADVYTALDNGGIVKP